MGYQLKRHVVRIGFAWSSSKFSAEPLYEIGSGIGEWPASKKVFSYGSDGACVLEVFLVAM